MKNGTARAARLTLALTVTLVLAAPANATAQGATCIHAKTPPAPPGGGAMLWAAPLSDDDLNAVMISQGENNSWLLNGTRCGGRVVQNPRVISVDRGAVLGFVFLKDGEPNCLVNWGAANVGLSDPPPVIAPDASKVGCSSTTFEVEVATAAVEALAGAWSCRGCDFSDAAVKFAPPPDGWIIVGYAGDFTGATFRGTLTGPARSFNFARADLSSAHAAADFTGATFDHAIVDRTSFDHAQLQGATFTSLQFRTPPTFGGATFGSLNPGGACTSFANTNLLDVSFDQVTWSTSACPNPTFPQSQISMPFLRDLLVTAKVPGINLSGAQVVASGADRGLLAGANLSGANLDGLAFLGEALDLTGTNFTGASLKRVDLSLARLAGATLTNVSAAEASFNLADLSGDGTHSGANFAGPQTNLQSANFVNANVSGASFAGADLTSANFTAVLAVDTDFSGVTAKSAVFTQAHLYGNGKAFINAKDLQDIDFTDAVLAADASESGKFDFTGAPLAGARFDGAVCVACNLTNACLTGAPLAGARVDSAVCEACNLPNACLTGAYLPAVVLAGATLDGASFDRAWLYCGGPSNPKCGPVRGSQPPLWQWPLALGSGEAFGPVPFGKTDLTGVAFDKVSSCPGGNAGSQGGCAGTQLLPRPSDAPPIPTPCSASARGACPTPTSTLVNTTPSSSSALAVRPLAVVSSVPPTWNTTLSDKGYYVAYDDGTVRLVSSGISTIVAGTPGTKCSGGPSSPCGDGGPATAASLWAPTGLAVGFDGSLYIADPAPVLRVRVIDPSGTITTVAGNGLMCPTVACGDGGPATAASLKAANGVAVDVRGVLLIADGIAGVRRVATDGTITTLAPGLSNGDVVSVASSAAGPIYAATRGHTIIQIDPTSGAVTPVVGTGVSGYNGNSDLLNNNAPLPGTQVQVNQPLGLSIDLDGNVLFADSANHLIRAYVPSTTHVINVAGKVIGPIPQGGFNGDGLFATDTELNVPMGVTATRGPLRVIADTANQRVRQVAGPGDTKGAAGSEAVVSCGPGTASSCRRLPGPPVPVGAENTGAVTISQDGIVFATGGSFLLAGSRLRLHLTEHRPLLPGRYDLVIVQAGRPRHQTIWLDQAPGVTERRRR